MTIIGISIIFYPTYPAGDQGYASYGKHIPDNPSQQLIQGRISYLPLLAAVRPAHAGEPSS